MKRLTALFLAIILIVTLTAGVSACKKTQPTPQCPAPTGPGRSEKEISDAFEMAKTVTITDSEATRLVQQVVPEEVEDPRVCFTPGLGHFSGKVKLGPLTVSFYVSGGVDLSGSSPQVTDMDIKLGGVPNLPGVNDQAAKAITEALNQVLSDLQTNGEYSVSFSQGSATIKDLH